MGAVDGGSVNAFLGVSLTRVMRGYSLINTFRLKKKMCVDIFYLKQSCLLCVSSKRETSTDTMPLHQAAPRLPVTRFHLPSKPRQRILESIEEWFCMFQS